MAAKAAKPLLEEETKSFIRSCDSFIFDLDGVLWLQNELIPGSTEFVKCLKQLGKKVFFVTNCNTISRNNFMKKFEKYGIEVDKSELYTSAFAIAYYLKHIVKFDKKVYMIGGKGLSEELDEVGIPNIGYGCDESTPEDKDVDMQYDKDFELDPEVGCVVTGFDQLISIKKFIKATSYLVKNESCLFVASNPDDRMPVPSHKNYYSPGSGCFAAFLEKAARRSPVYAGKPSPILFDCIVNKHKTDPARTCMIGDTLETDMLFGNKCGTKTLLVLSGNASLEILENVIQSIDSNSQQSVPDFVIPSVGHLLPFAKELLNECQ